MSLDFSAPFLVALLLGVVRAGTFIVVAPPFASRTVPGSAKAVLALALTLPVVPRLAEQVPEVTVPALLGAAVLQALTGAALGFVTYLFFAAIQAAGDLVDLFGGFTVSMAYDPLSMTSTSVFGRFYQLLATTLLFVSGGHLLIVNGFVASYDAVPLTASIDLARLAPALVTGLGELFLAALQIAAPLIGVLFVADLALGLLTKVSPSLNVFALGFPIKILLTVALVGFTFPLLPGAVDGVVDLAVRAVASVVGL